MNPADNRSQEDPSSDAEDANQSQLIDDQDNDADQSKKKGQDNRHNKHHARKLIHQPKPKPPGESTAPDYVQTDVDSQGIFLYKPGVDLPNLYPFMQKTVTIIIASEYINKQNPEYVKRSLYGTEAYTANSDAVCVAVHCGFVNINSFNHKKYQGIELYCKVAKPKRTYPSATKNGIVSKLVKGYNGNAIKPEGYKPLQYLPPIQLLQKYAENMHVHVGTKRIRPKPRSTSSVIPIPETHIVFNMNNEPAYKYSIFNIADKGFDKSEWVIKKLDHSVLYLEAEDVKYEIFKDTVKEFFDAFRFSIVKNPEKMDNEYFAKHPPPLAEDQLQVLYKDLEWEDLLWGRKSIKIKDKQFGGLKSFKYYRMAK